MTALKFGKLLKAAFVVRENRYRGVVDIGGTPVCCYIPDPGRGRELFVKGAETRVLPANDPSRKTKLTLLMVKHNGTWVSVDTGAPTRLLFKLLSERRIPELARYTKVRREPAVGHHRLDFLLSAGPEIAYVEVKSVTLVRNGLARFPDAPTERGTRHLDLLAQLAARGSRCYIFFLIQRKDADAVFPNFNTDPGFSASLLKAISRGVTPIAYTANITPRGITVDKQATVLSQKPGEFTNSGAYQLVIHVSEDTVLKSGRFQDRKVPAGYYIYTGSAMKHLYPRLARHLKSKDKKFHWHIDYLLALKHARIIDIVIRPSARRIECDLNRKTLALPGAGTIIPRFGSTDCRTCPSHLSHFRTLPAPFLDRLPCMGTDLL